MSHSSSFLPAPTSRLVSTVARFTMLTSTQLHRLHYGDTNPGAYVRSRRHLARLTRLGLLRRIWGVYDGPAQYIYLHPESKARTANMHTLDITELYVRLKHIYSSGITGIPGKNEFIFDPEPYCHVQVGHMLLKPDAYIDMGDYRYFLELDRSTQFRAALAEKMRRYIQAYEKWEEDTFPQVLFVVHDSDRKRFVQGVIHRQSEPRLFKVCLFNDFLEAVRHDN